MKLWICLHLFCFTIDTNSTKSMMVQGLNSLPTKKARKIKDRFLLESQFGKWLWTKSMQHSECSLYFQTVALATWFLGSLGFLGEWHKSLSLVQQASQSNISYDNNCKSFSTSSILKFGVFQLIPCMRLGTMCTGLPYNLPLKAQLTFKLPHHCVL